jgi:hypothetical protein
MIHETAATKRRRLYLRSWRASEHPLRHSFPVGDHGAGVGRDPRYDVRLPEKDKLLVRNRASNASARQLPFGDRRVTPSVQCGHFSRTDTVRIWIDHQPVMVDFLHSLSQTHREYSSVESKETSARLSERHLLKEAKP